jgi:hypothetical protein
VLFSGSEQGKLGSWGYVQAHRAELDRTAAAVFFDRGAGRVIGFSLGGRSELEAGVREALAPLDSWSLNRYTSDAASGSENFDFLLEGVPNLLANQENAGYSNRHSTADSYDKVDLEALKHNTAVAGVLVFALAERAEPLGLRLSRAQTEALLERSGVAATIRQTDLWRFWESGQRGRQP